MAFTKWRAGRTGTDAVRFVLAVARWRDGPLKKPAVDADSIVFLRMNQEQSRSQEETEM